jgi:hypothetical protein
VFSEALLPRCDPDAAVADVVGTASASAQTQQRGRDCRISIEAAARARADVLGATAPRSLELEVANVLSAEMFAVYQSRRSQTGRSVDL